MRALITASLAIGLAAAAAAQTPADPGIVAHCKDVAKSLGSHSYLAELGCVEMETAAKRELEFREALRRPVIKAPSTEQEVRDECSSRPDPKGCVEWGLLFLNSQGK